MCLKKKIIVYIVKSNFFVFCRVGDYILSINSTEVTGLPDHKVQQIIRLLPRGLAKIVVSVTPPDLSKIGKLELISWFSNTFVFLMLHRYLLSALFRY